MASCVTAACPIRCLLRRSSMRSKICRRHVGLSAWQPLLRNGPAFGSCMAVVREDAARLGTGPGHLRFRPSPLRIRIPARPGHQDGLGSLQRRQRRMPRLRSSCHRILSRHEYSGALLHWVSKRHRHAQALGGGGFRRLVRSLYRRALAHIRSAQQRAANRARFDCAGARRLRCSNHPDLRAKTEGSVVRKSGTMTSDARVKCVPNTMIIGVGCGNSYSISNPTRSFIRNTFPTPARSKLATKPSNTRLWLLIRSNRPSLRENDS